MLNIPQTIKDLFKTDGVLKNIRISFPNEERADICNDQIIKESLKFDESISSREEIKFGLCESSQLSFECVDVGNIKGMEIEAAIEIDVTGHERTEYPVDTECPVFLKIEIDGNTYYVIVSDFPEIEAGQTYTTDDDTGLYYDTWMDENTTWMKMHFLNYAHYESVVGERAIYASKIYFYSTKEGKFYGGCIAGWTSSEHFELSFPLNSAFTDDEWLSAIHNMRYDSTNNIYWGSDFEPTILPDVPFPFYRVPLGRFIVDEAKRDAGMTRRKVVAYSKFSGLPYYDWWSLPAWNSVTHIDRDKSLSLKVMNYILSANNDAFDTEFEGTVITGWKTLYAETGQNSEYSFGYSFKSPSSGNTYGVTFTTYSNRIYINKLETYSMDKPWGSLSKMGRLALFKNSTNYETTVSNVMAYLSRNGVENDVLPQVREAIEIFNDLDPINFYRLDESAFPLDYETRRKTIKKIRQSEMFMMPPWLAVFTEMRVHLDTMPESQSEYVTYIDTGNAFGNSVKVEELDMPYDNFIIKVNPELLDITGAGQNFGTFSFFKPMLYMDLRKMLEDCAELLGCFGRMGRDGYFQFLALAEISVDGLFPAHDIYPISSLYPHAYTPITQDVSGLAIINDDDMISLWYEEYFIQYGAIVCEYKSSEILDESNNPTQVVYENQWQSGLLTYDVSDNEIIKNNTWTATQIRDLFAPLIQALKKIKFYPSDLSCVGLPYIEAGDWVLASYHGNRVLGLVLSRTLSGIQALRDKMKSD